MPRAVDALEAAWKRDDRAPAAPEDSGVGELPLAQPIAEFGATVLETMTLTSTGEPDEEDEDLVPASVSANMRAEPTHPRQRRRRPATMNDER
ncbi:hypothetical protein [Kitasatospora sp. NPDC057223]|uniref:hypothetical protein n=1 Tax=Kitasatospora sp. NPDC057223 TaxID=3346055 RepID=UPI003643E139